MLNNVLVSVVCLTYNHEKYIRRTLDGFLAQKTNFAFEIIVHDDASTDRTAEIIREYAAAYPDLFHPILQTRNQFSQGVQIKRDIIFPVARGKYIAHCEGDDYWIDPLKLQKQVDFLEANPDYSASTHNCCFVDGEGNPIDSIYPMYRHCASHRYTLKRFAADVVYPGQTATLVHRKDAFCEFNSEEEKDAFYGMRIATGDKRMYLKLLTVGDIYCFEDTMSAYRIVTQGGDSWTAKTRDKNLSYALHVASIDFRQYVKKYAGKPFANYYTTFHTGVAGIVKSVIRPTPENKEVCRRIVQLHHGVVGTAIYLLGLGLISIPLYFSRRKESRKYEIKD